MLRFWAEFASSINSTAPAGIIGYVRLSRPVSVPQGFQDRLGLMLPLSSRRNPHQLRESLPVPWMRAIALANPARITMRHFKTGKIGFF
jgi:hypothetical protein